MNIHLPAILGVFEWFWPTAIWVWPRPNNAYQASHTLGHFWWGNWQFPGESAWAMATSNKRIQPTLCCISVIVCTCKMPIENTEHPFSRIGSAWTSLITYSNSDIANRNNDRSSKTPSRSQLPTGWTALNSLNFRNHRDLRQTTQPSPGSGKRSIVAFRPKSAISIRKLWENDKWYQMIISGIEDHFHEQPFSVVRCST